jgi:hypothetical protein
MKNKTLAILALTGILTGAIGISTGVISIIMISNQYNSSNPVLNVYFCQTVQDIEFALSEIGTNSGDIYIVNDIALDSSINISGGGIYKFQGLGDITIFCEDGVSAFEISKSKYCFISDIDLDITGYTSDQIASINIHENDNNPVILSNININGDFDYKGLGINVNSSDVWISESSFNNLWSGVIIQETSSGTHIYDNYFKNNFQRGILCLGDKNVVQDNVFEKCYYDFIYIEGNENKISNNYMKNHSRWGITVEGTNFGGSRNIISCNSILGIPTNSISPTGILMYHLSVDNLIIGNMVHGLQITSGGTGTGITVLSTSQNTSIIANSIYGNDINLNDMGINTFLEANNFNEETNVFYCETGNQVQEALDSIGTDSGEIVITEDFVLSSTINIDGGGEYIIRSTGQHIIDCGGNRNAFIITRAQSCVIRDLKVDASGYSSNSYEAIEVFEENNNSVYLENLDIFGDTDFYGYGIRIRSNNVRVMNCRIHKFYRAIDVYLNTRNLFISNNYIFDNDHSGLVMRGTECLIDSNHFSNCIYTASSQVWLVGNHCVFSDNIIDNTLSIGLNLNTGTSNGGFNLISGNIIKGIVRNDAQTSYGIYATNNADNNTITNNLITDFYNSGGGNGYGLYILSTCDYNTITSNTIIANNINIIDGGSHNFFDANNAP